MRPLIDFVHANADDAAALDAYLAQPAEYRAVPIAIVNAYLIDRFLIGSLRLARDNEQMPLLVRSYLGTLLTGIQVAEAFHGENPTIRGATEQVLAVLVQAQVMSQPDADGFRALYTITPAGTLADVASLRALLARGALRTRILDAQSRAMIAAESGKTVAEVRDALLAGFGEVA